MTQVLAGLSVLLVLLLVLAVAAVRRLDRSVGRLTRSAEGFSRREERDATQ